MQIISISRGSEAFGLPAHGPSVAAWLSTLRQADKNLNKKLAIIKRELL